MKLSALVFLSLLGLVSASLQDIVERSSRHRRAPPYLSNLKWVPWAGSLPDTAVSIYNTYKERTDYVCKYDEVCAAGFYNRAMGPKCHYPWGDKEYTTTEFHILVNKDNQVLEWQDGSYGSVPPNSVRTCPDGGYAGGYVGKNQYGLGKVSIANRAFFLPYEGKEYWYKTYQVLVEV